MLKSSPPNIEVAQFENLASYRCFIKQAILALLMTSSVAVVNEIGMTVSRINVAIASPVDRGAELLVSSLLYSLENSPSFAKTRISNEAKGAIINNLQLLFGSRGITPKKVASRLERGKYTVPPELGPRVDELKMIFTDLDGDTSWEDMVPELDLFVEEISPSEVEVALRAYQKTFRKNKDKDIDRREEASF